MIRKLIFSAILLLSLHVGLHAQSKDEKAVAAAVEKLRVAMIEGNRAELENIALEGLSYGHSSGVVENKKEFVEAIASGKSDFVTIELTDQKITMSGKTALVRHKFTGSTNDGGRQGRVNIHVLLVWQKAKGGWKLLARQAVRAN